MLKNYPKKIHCYEVPSSTEQAPNMKDYYFVPNKFVDIDKYLNDKTKLFSRKCYLTKKAPSSITNLPEDGIDESLKGKEPTLEKFLTLIPFFL